MATFIVLAKIASFILALRFFQIIISIKTDPHEFRNLLKGFGQSLKLYFGGLLLIVILSFIPFEKMLADVKDKFTAQPAATINKKNLYGSWKIHDTNNTIRYDSNKTFALTVNGKTDDGKWEVNDNKLTLKFKKWASTYTILELSPSSYFIKDDETGEKFKAKKR